MARSERDAYDESRGKCGLTYDELEGLLMDPLNTYRDIAALAGVTRQRVHQLCKQYFPGVVRTHYERMRSEARCRDVARGLPKDSPAGIVAQAALARSLDVQAIRCEDSHWAMKELRINGHWCVVHSARTRYAGYHRLGLTIRQIAKAHAVVGVLQHGGKRRIVIVPVADILTRLPASRAAVMLYIPVGQRRPQYRNHGPVVAWEQYEDAWHLLAT